MLIGDNLWNAQLLKPLTEKDVVLFPKGQLSASQMVASAINQARYTLDKRSSVNGRFHFGYIREAGKLCALEFPSHIRFFVFLVDISPCMQEYSPSLFRDPSNRYREIEDEGLPLENLRPHISRHTFDVQVLPPGTNYLRH